MLLQDDSTLGASLKSDFLKGLSALFGSDPFVFSLW